jgi:hypothetical protein
MSKPAIVTFVLAAFLATGCVASGSNDAQVASWRRQLERNPDARISRPSWTPPPAPSRDSDGTADGVAMELAFWILLGLIL